MKFDAASVTIIGNAQIGLREIFPPQIYKTDDLCDDDLHSVRLWLTFGKRPVIKTQKIFFGWWTVLACGVVGFLGVGFASQGFSVLFKPIAEELELTRAATSVAAGVQSVGQGIAGLIGGWTSDRYGPRRVMLFGILCLALGCIMMYFIGSLWTFLVVWGLIIGAGFYFGFTIVTDKAIVNWFIRRSGIALNVKFAIQSLAGVLLLPLIAWLIINQGWRMTCVIAGLFIALVSIPLTWFFVKPHRPEYYGSLPDGETRNGETTEVNRIIDTGTGHADKVDEVEFTLGQTMRTPTYWLMIVVAYISGLGMPIMSVHVIPFLTDMEITPVKAASMMALILTSSIPVRIVTGLIVDRVKTGHLRFIIAAGYFLQAVGVITFLITKSMAMIYLWFLLYGIGSGAAFSAQLPMWARYFGRKAFGSILGSMMMLNMPIGLITPVYVGWVYDTTGSYESAFRLFALLVAISTVVACFILPPKPPKQVI